jgi:hypothetical protein
MALTINGTNTSLSPPVRIFTIANQNGYPTSSIFDCHMVLNSSNEIGLSPFSHSAIASPNGIYHCTSAASPYVDPQYSGLKIK